MLIERIYQADMYRDGGSFGIKGLGKDSEKYTVWIEVKGFPGPLISYHPPVLWHGSPDNGQVVQNLTWNDAAKLVDSHEIDPVGSSQAELQQFLDSCYDCYERVRQLVRTYIERRQDE